MSNYQDEIKQATELKKQAGSSWHDITPEYVARMRLQNRFKTEFENIANRLLEEKSQKFSAHNQQQMGELLNPLREKIKTFEENIERRFVEETRDRVSLNASY